MSGGWGRGLGVFLLCAASGLATAAGLAEWPEGWQVTRSPEAPDDATVLRRERGVKLAADGSQALVVEITRSRLAEVKDVDLQRVILQMRKSLQVDFLRQGFQAACSKPRQASLGGLDGLELVCSISQNGNEAMKQGVQVALGKEAAYSLTYAAPAADYPQRLAEVAALKAGLRLE